MDDDEAYWQEVIAHPWAQRHYRRAVAQDATTALDGWRRRVLWWRTISPMSGFACGSRLDRGWNDRGSELGGR